MRYQTELMSRILTNEKAQEIIDYVSQIYGESYVGLWIYQAIGTALGNIDQIANQLMNETTPVTTTLLIDYWENEFGLTPDSRLTIAQRQSRLIDNIKSRGAITPEKLSSAVSASLGGAAVAVYERTGTITQSTASTSNNGTVTLLTEANTSAESNGNVTIISPASSASDNQGNVVVRSMTGFSDGSGHITVTSNTHVEHEGNGVVTLAATPENYYFEINNNELMRMSDEGGAYKFTVNILDSVSSVKPAIATINKLKPAHLIYDIKSTLNMDASTNSYVGVATTLAVHNAVTVV